MFSLEVENLNQLLKVRSKRSFKLNIITIFNVAESRDPLTVLKKASANISQNTYTLAFLQLPLIYFRLLKYKASLPNCNFTSNIIHKYRIHARSEKANYLHLSILVLFIYFGWRKGGGNYYWIDELRINYQKVTKEP